MSHRRLSTVLKALSPLVFLGGCVSSFGIMIGNNGRGGDAVGGISFFVAVAMLLAGIALKRHVRVAEQPQQTITLARLLNNPSFSAYAFDNARAKVLDLELRETLTGLKQGLLISRDIKLAETFEL